MTDATSQPTPILTMLEQAQRAYAAGDLGASESACMKILQTHPREYNALKFLGQIAHARGLFDQAAACLERCHEHHPGQAEILTLRARVSASQGHSDEALEWLERAIALEPDALEPHVRKAFVLERKHEYDAARATIAPFIERGIETPQLVAIRCTIALHAGELEEAIRLADLIADRGDVDPLLRRQVAFHRGNAHDRLGDPDRAFDSWRLANELFRRPFDPVAWEKGVDDAIRFFSAERMAVLARSTDRSPLPVFVAGMPRTGTTLVEQIIDAHPRGAGAGELTDLERLGPTLPARLKSFGLFPQCLEQLTPEVADDLAAAYLERLATLGGENAERVVNKSLDNFKYLGLIALLLPGARVIRCRRDPMDAGLSIYAAPLNPKRYPFASDLGHIGIFHRLAERLLDHWGEVLDLPTHDVVYEDLVVEPEPAIRRLIEFCGLDWDDRCLRYHESGRTVMTISYHGVAQPIYTSSVGRHRQYVTQLGPLRDALELDDGAV